MIIDLILDAKDNYVVMPLDNFHKEYLRQEAEVFGFDYILEAITSGSNKAVQKALCGYIDKNDYNPVIKDFINKSKWV